MYKLVAYKEELKNLTDKDIIDFYGRYDWFFGISKSVMKDVGAIMSVGLEEYDKNRRDLRERRGGDYGRNN
ncbi:unnamed protein product [Rhizophagus irregularis]|nr:unnamed protein product [Rhizophagus irregularis]CAB5366125.1 unnamed protein product [Rhizophagus irregularis]